MSDNPASPRVPWPLRYLLIASLLICLLAVGSEFLRSPAEIASAPVSKEGSPDQLIIPALRVDFITLGLAISDVEKKLGPGKIKPTSQATLYYFAATETTCGVQDQRVVSVLTRGAAFHTRGGVRVGTPVDQVVREFGDHYEYEKLDPKEDYYTLHYWQSGMHVTVKNNAVQSLMVTASLSQDDRG